MTLGERVRTYREELEMDQPALAAAVRAQGGSASQSTISDIELGKSLNPRCLPQLAEIFGVSEKQLRNGNGAPSIPPRANVRGHAQPVEEIRPNSDSSPGDNSVAKVVTFRGRLAETGRLGGWLIYPERAAGFVELAPSLGEAPRIFKVEVLDADNSPVYERRDVLSCDPDRQPLPNNYCVFVSDRGPDGGAPAVLGKLLRETGTEWVVKPFAAPELKLLRETWPCAWVVFRRDQAI